MIEYLSGAVTVGFIVASALLASLWRRRGDRLYLALAVALALLAVNQMLAVWLTDAHPLVGYVYLLRSVGFVFVVATMLNWIPRGRAR